MTVYGALLIGVVCFVGGGAVGAAVAWGWVYDDADRYANLCLLLKKS